MRPELLDLILTTGSPAVHPDGTFALVPAIRASFEADAYTGQLWRVPLDGSEPTRSTRGVRDTSPRFSPDGRLVAFLRPDANGRAQVFVAPAHGGEAAQATAAKLGVGEHCWSPDSTTLAFTARVPEEGRYGTLDGVGATQEDPRHLTGYQVQSNGLGWSRDRVRQLFVVEAPDPFAEPPVEPVGRAAAGRAADAPAWQAPEARRLTHGAWDVATPVFAPDGDAVLVTTRSEEDADEHLRTAVHRVALASGATDPVVADPRLSFSDAQPSNDGAWLFVLGSDLGDDGRDFVATNAALYVVGRDGGAPVRLTDPESHELDGPLVPVDADAVLVVRGHRGGSELLRVDASGDVRVLASGGPTVLAAAAASGAVVATVATPGSPGELAVVEPDGPRVLTDFAARLRERTTIVEPVEVTATAPDGTPVHGWTLTPAGPGPHPVLLTIHGGPYHHYGPDWFDEFQVYVEAGYAVVACNPRGSGTYGQAHGAAIRHDFGRLDSIDVLAFLDHALATVPGLDADRVGVMGGSYGGYLTAWLIAHEHRFAGAIVERGFLDPASFVGSSDIGWFFAPAYNGTDRETQDRQSPMLLADRVRTPTLVVHSELDLRCPLAQALRYHALLKAAGVESELLVFPGEDHELSRAGTPWHRRQRFEAILDWWGRHLPVSGRGAGG